ncbi:MAG: hypothetical protein PWQ68_33 [Thermoanaerobacteraceae bacterium]|jgi:hypothetical protein|nr:hypothetical protein [Thermoanaerobacteraceae bacterium]
MTLIFPGGADMSNRAVFALFLVLILLFFSDGAVAKEAQDPKKTEAKPTTK